MKKLLLVACVSSGMMSNVTFAATHEHTQPARAVPENFQYQPKTDEAATPVSAATTRPPAFWHTDILPIWGEEARARGYDLPEPFGININYMNIRQNIDVESIKFKGLGWSNFNIPTDVFNIGVGNTRQKSKTRTIKLDAWVLPFWNVYGIIGKTRGSSLSKVSVNADPSKYNPGSPEWMIAYVVNQLNKNGDLNNLDFKLNFKGDTYGVGTVLTGGYNNWFGLVDVNYTQTKFDILDGSIDAFTVSPRVGYRFDTPGISSIYLPPGKLNVWLGTMYQNVQQEFKGKLSDLKMPGSLSGMMEIADRNGNGRFDVKQHLESPWNMLVGAQYEITRNFNVTTEFGFAKRNSVFVSGEFRF